MTPLVSILIPCFNAERWVGQAIHSALEQTWPDKEVIVVDDGSTDGSLAVIQSFGNRIRWETGPNRGGNVARNRLLELGRGEWLQYLDADDYLLPHKISEQMAFVASHPQVDIAYGPVVMEHCTAQGARQVAQPIIEPHDPWILLARWFLPQTGAALWRRQAIVDVGGWKPDQPCCQEHELYLRLLIAGKCFAYSDAGGAIYRQWGEHTTCKKDKPEVHRRRLAIERQAEEYLRATSALTKERQWAINQARFEVARSAWHFDSTFAAEIIALVLKTDDRFIPDGPVALGPYRALFQLFGFRTAESIADLRRKVFRGSPRESLARGDDNSEQPRRRMSHHLPVHESPGSPFHPRSRSLLARGLRDDLKRFLHRTNRAVRIIAGTVANRRPATTLLMVHNARCGSTVIGKAVDSQPGMLWDGEIFTKAGNPRDIQPTRLISRRAPMAIGGHYGFELQFYNCEQMKVQLRDILSSIHDDVDNLHICALRRRNELRHMVSVIAGLQIGEWRCDGSFTTERVRIQPELVPHANRSLLSCIERNAEAYSDVELFCSAHSIPFVELTYEDHVEADPNVAAERICKLVGVTNFRRIEEAVRTGQKKTISELVSDLDDVRLHLAGTAHEWMLEGC